MQYKLNDRAVSWEQYNRRLEGFNILVKARNFLVFQVGAAGVWWVLGCPNLCRALTQPPGDVAPKSFTVTLRLTSIHSAMLSVCRAISNTLHTHPTPPTLLAPCSHCPAGRQRERCADAAPRPHQPV